VLDVDLEGYCTCRAVRYRIGRRPLIVHCCHCLYCQRETGSAFVINALLEADAVTLSGAAPELVRTPSASGKGQDIARCPECRVAVFSHYAQARTAICFVRVGTLANPALLAPDVHIYTASKMPWVTLPPGVPAFEAYYDAKQLWSEEARERWVAAVRRGS
jgi:hypothetical protein